MLEFLADLPDLWDITVHDYSYEMGTSRFTPEAALEATMSWVKSVTDKPVVSVGRFTSPETMLRLVRDGVVDLVGAARRPSLIRSCPRRSPKDVTTRSANASAATSATPATRPAPHPVHPEPDDGRRVAERLASRTHRAEGIERPDPGRRRRSRRPRSGGVFGQARLRRRPGRGPQGVGGPGHARVPLPGLGQWARVRDWRLNQIEKLKNVEVFLESMIDEAQILEFAPDRVVVATGAKWRRDGIGRWHTSTIPGSESPSILTPDDVMAADTSGPVVVFDDDHYYIGGVLAEALRLAGLEVTLVTPANEVSTWTTRPRNSIGSRRRSSSSASPSRQAQSSPSVGEGSVILESVHTEATRGVEAANVVLVTSREPVDTLYHLLRDRIPVQRIGDCLAPGTIATAVYSGHRYAREADAEVSLGVPFARE